MTSWNRNIEPDAIKYMIHQSWIPLWLQLLFKFYCRSLMGALLASCRNPLAAEIQYVFNIFHCSLALFFFFENCNFIKLHVDKNRVYFPWKQKLIIFFSFKIFMIWESNKFSLFVLQTYIYNKSAEKFLKMSRSCLISNDFSFPHASRKNILPAIWLIKVTVRDKDF